MVIWSGYIRATRQWSYYVHEYENAGLLAGAIGSGFEEIFGLARMHHGRRHLRNLRVGVLAVGD